MSLFWFRAFVSHSSRDEALVRALQDNAAGLGIEIYLAEHDLRPGHQLSTKIQREIERSHAVIVLLTTAAADSSYVQQEIGYALKARRYVIPLVERGLSADKLAMLQGKEYIELDPEDPDAAMQKAGVYLESLKDRKDFIDAALATVVVVGLIYLWSSGEGGLAPPSV